MRMFAERGTDSIRDHFDRLAEIYDIGTSDWVADRCILGTIADLIKEGPVLDLACGTGIVSRFLLERQPNLAVYGLDISPRMCAAARRQGIRTFLGRAERMPFEDHSFSTIVCRQGLHYVDVSDCLRECRRVLRPGGRIVCAQIGSDEGDEGAWWREVKRVLQPLRKRWLIKNEVEDCMGRNGFVIGRIRVGTARSQRTITQWFAATNQEHLPPWKRKLFLLKWTNNSPQSIRLRISSSDVSFEQRWLVWWAQPKIP